jgi:hypothetical protein
MNKQGTLIFVSNPLNQWPIEKEIMKQVIENGTMTLIGTPESTLRIILKFSDTSFISLETCPITNIGCLPRCVVCVVWNGDYAKIKINTNVVASTDNQNIEKSILLNTEHKTRKENFFIDISVLNNDAYIQRINDYGKDDPKRFFKILSDTLHCLEHHINLVNKGKNCFLPSIAQDLRLLIAKGGATMKPLLQRVAGITSSPLILYSIPPSMEEIPYVSDLSFKLAVSFSLNKQTNAQVETDIDTWLNFKDGFFLKNKKNDYTNNDLIRAYADKDAAHIDDESDPLWAFLGDSTLNVSTFFVQISACVLNMGKQLLLKGSK